MLGYYMLGRLIFYCQILLHYFFFLNIPICHMKNIHLHSYSISILSVQGKKKEACNIETLTINSSKLVLFRYSGIFFKFEEV